jgi:16S rRNA processing protein RimM
VKPPADRLRVLARVTGLHGVAGKVKALSLTDVPGHLAGAQTLWSLAPGRERKRFRLEQVQTVPGGFILKFSGLSNPEEARPLLGSELAVEESGLAALPEGTYAAADLKGLRVEDEAGTLLGKLSAIYPTGANDVYEIQPPSGSSYLIPAIREVVRKVDLDGGRILVRLLPGLGPEDGGT